ncbi:MAG: SUMF1/EgtB/PvdO family nonheme iron enzyme [Anaerolineales bacterium]|jgi:hypothetical protein|nr:SUMF1/EgtB/PvdO family nonheme iron enzyme [Anaerolineales bacterium]
MSNWIRINDDTYIDDSLVTCAEYQLFIDEMRVQEKYHQPDHWQEYRFPKGHARQPILGMRHSDAVAFCEWLTRHNNDGWKYRLPTQSEAQEISAAKAYTPPIGYWLATQAKQNFAWVGQIPKNPRSLTSMDGDAIASAFTINLDLASILALDLDLASALAFTLDFDLARARALAINRKRARDININIALDHARDIVLDHAGDIAPDIARDIARNIVRGRANNRALIRIRNFSINLYVDIITLQARINGTSPAFEGIRLVRERIK